MPENESNQVKTNRSDFYYFSAVPTRWIDNDIYGHVNNAVYYQYFDTVANEYLIEKGGLDISSNIVAFIVASSCQYHSPIAHPARLDVGFRVNRLGKSSVEYGMGIFVDGATQAAANGTFTHVFVNRATGGSVAIPDKIRIALQAVLIQKLPP